VRVFARWGWNEGRHESFAHTEANSTIAGGADVHYLHNFKTGFAAATGGISADHKAYLAAGGVGFLLGRLRYGRETVLESYTTYNFPRGISASVDLQFIANPGYNRDRGPVGFLRFGCTGTCPSFRGRFEGEAIPLHPSARDLQLSTRSTGLDLRAYSCSRWR
jgi:hypothetical protein